VQNLAEIKAEIILNVIYHNLFAPVSESYFFWPIM